MKYNNPNMEIIEFKIEDAIHTSPGLNGVGSNVNQEGVLEDDGEEWN